MAPEVKDDAVLLARKYLKRKIMCLEGEFRQYAKERSNVLELVKRTIEMGESNSALLIGPRGSGKNILINSVLKELCLTKEFENNGLLINLHGLIHTDDRLALKDITRQMQLENVIGDRMFSTFAENMNCLLDCLKSGDKKHSKPLIFVLDEFDLFCEHRNQTLLYNLFDIAQSAQAPICVLGLTCRLDVMELLEKRVKSRFSHRQIFLFPGVSCVGEKPKLGFEIRLQLFRELLSFVDNKNMEGEYQLNYLKINTQFKAMWNEYIDSLSNNIRVVNLLKQMYQTDVSERSFRNFLSSVVSMLSEDHRNLEIDDFIEASKRFSTDEKILVLEGLSVLEICLIIAIKHETEIYEGEPFNFESIYNRYVKFVNRNSSVQNVQRRVIMKAFEHIRNLEILIPASNAYGKIEKEYQYYKFMLSAQQVTEAVKSYSGLPTEVAQWAFTTFE